MGQFLEMGLVAFDLQEIIAPFLGYGPGNLALAVQRLRRRVLLLRGARFARFSLV